MAYSEKVVDHYNNPRTSAVCPRKIPMSGPAWWVHRSAAT